MPGILLAGKVLDAWRAALTPPPLPLALTWNMAVDAKQLERGET
jgi:hypothetical protein